MRRSVLLFLALAALAWAPASDPRERVQSHLRRLRGRWVEDRSVQVESRALVDITMGFRGETMGWEGNLYAVTLDPRHRLAHFDLVGLNESVKGNAFDGNKPACHLHVLKRWKP